MVGIREVRFLGLTTTIAVLFCGLCVVLALDDRGKPEVSCEAEFNGEFGHDISVELGDVTAGEKLFTGLCSACHSFKSDGIGPGLAGLTLEVESDWIRQFIQSPRRMINQQDARAVAVFEEYGTFMPPFQHLETSQILQIIAYMHTHQVAPVDSTSLDPDLEQVKVPYPNSSTYSEVILEIEETWSIPASAERKPIARINEMTCEESQGRLFVHDLRGRIYELEEDGRAVVYCDIADLVPAFVDGPGLNTGLGSIAFHPHFAENGLLYTTHCEKPSGRADEQVAGGAPSVIDYVLREWEAEDPTAVVFTGSGRELLRMEMITGKHGMQTLTFNPTATSGDPDFGMLYLGIGDGASVEEGYPEHSLHQGKALWSSIIRIDPQGQNADNGRYGIPSDNPFVEDTSKRAELWAYGFRNPNQLHWDVDGAMYATDIGLAQAEELNRVVPGKFYGWPLREGDYMLNYRGKMGHVYALPEDDEKYAIEYPMMALGHPDLDAIMGGGIYRNSSLAELEGKYLFGDISSGTLYYAPLLGRRVADNEIKRWRVMHEGSLVTFQDFVGSNRVDLRFGFDCNDDLFLMSKAIGKIYKVTQRKHL